MTDERIIVATICRCERCSAFRSKIVPDPRRCDWYDNLIPSPQPVARNYPADK